MKIKTKRILISSVCVFSLLGLILASLFLPLLRTSSPQVVYIDSNDDIDSVYNKVEEKISGFQIQTFKLCSFFINYKEHIYDGRYDISGCSNTIDLIRKMRGGRQDPVRLVIPITHTLNSFVGRISQYLESDSITMLKTFHDSEIVKALQTTTENLPCLFIPNTYEVYWNISPKDFLFRMKREHDAFWNSSRRELAEKMGLSTNEVYTLASIVEQESSNRAERPIIAGMYLNRLRKGMKLQADPTVKFALGDFSIRRILHEHLTVNSPYNTYQNLGLPIGPICIPSLNSIESVLHYRENSYLYMCAKEDFSGTHNFATTYSEHLHNAKKYTDALNKRGIK